MKETRNMMLFRTFLASRGAVASLEQQGLPFGLAAASSSLLFSTKTAPDYSLAMKKADEISSNIIEAPKGEIGAYAGVPPETFKRAVSPPPLLGRKKAACGPSGPDYHGL